MSESLRQACNSTNSVIVLGGDFNFPGFNWKENTIKRRTQFIELHNTFQNLLDDLGLDQIVESPTHQDGNTLDLIITNQPNCFPRMEIAPGLSDHYIVYAELLIQPARPRQISRVVPRYRKADWDGLRKGTQNLTDSITSEFSASQNVESIWDRMKTGLNDLIKKFIPHRKLGPKRDQQWIDKKTLKLMKRRDRIHKKQLRTGREDLKEAYKNIQRDVQRRLRRQYWQHLDDLIVTDTKDQEAPKPNKQLYSYIKRKQNDNPGISPLKEAGKLVTDDKEKAEILNRQFQSAFSSKEDFTKEEFQRRCPMPLPPPEQPLLENISITIDGVQKLLASLDPSKAPGPDGLSPRVLKEIAAELAPALTLLYQASLDTGIVPSDWRSANVSPVYKKGERYKPENYRPISLTSILCKQLEHIVVSNIMSYCENHSILCHNQHGFRRGHSCETQLLGFADEVSKHLEKGSQEDL